jgi:hypothetical protein
MLAKCFFACEEHQGVVASFLKFELFLKPIGFELLFFGKDNPS